MKAIIALVVLCLSVAVVFAAPQKLTLKKLTVLNRHGHRAPNRPYWKMCPNDRYNLKQYDVTAEDLTGLGFEQEFAFGEYLHQAYGSFIGDKYNRFQHYCRAVGEPRTIQSAAAIMQGLFKSGFGPKGFQPNKPQVVPVFSDLDTHEYLIDDTPCWGNLMKDKKLWFDEFGTKMLAEKKNNETLEKLIKLCNTPKEIIERKGWDMFVKIAVDGVIFNHDYGIDVLHGQVDKEMMFNLRNISIQLLLGKLYGYDRQQTYIVVDFPDRFLTDFELVANHSAKQFPKLDIYCGHREELYGFAKFFNIDIRVSTYPPGELPVTATIFLELLEDEAAKVPTFYVKTWLWTPYNGKYTLAIPGCKNPHLCTLEEYRAHYTTRTKRTGTWEEICHYEKPALDKE